MPIVVHGDAAMSGQGIVFECLQMQSLKNYEVGGTVHVVINNQVGFTTTPDRQRSGNYCTDVAKTINAPVFHVNSQSMEDVMRVFKIAAEYRQTFHKDVVIDLVGYRKFGHNELDQPMFTQPLMYSVVKDILPVRDIYRQQLIDGGIPAANLDKIDAAATSHLEECYKKSKNLEFQAEDWATKQWDAIRDPKRYGDQSDTGVPKAELTAIGKKISVLPAEEKFHPQLQKIFAARNKAIVDGKGIDWGTAEALAFASLINEGYHVRLSGQDVERGTFSHRHAHVHYQDKDGHYVPINNVAGGSDSVRQFIASNSHLAEYAVLGFEYGYAQTSPDSLVLWEAQFGDFANGAQTMIDQFVSSGETKWNVKNGLVMLLPHGYDGAGPEHSSSRVERYLQLTDADDNPPEDDWTELHIGRNCSMKIVNCTTAAQYFHVLRRQIRRPFRKPLIVVAPKKLLKLKAANSDMESFDQGLRFKRVLPETSKDLVADNKVKRVIFCSGQVYYDLEGERTKRGIKDIAIVRVEELSPFPFRSIEPELKKYSGAEPMWVQEEPKNQGPWSFIEPRFRNLLRKMKHKSSDIEFSGRPISASTATGYGKQHAAELASFLNIAMK